MGRLDGKVALITGGASGMGMVASELFAAEGAKVVLTDVADDAGEQVAEKIRGGRRRGDLRPCRRVAEAGRGGDGALRGQPYGGLTSSTTMPA